jgi:hypothetical protein
VVGVKGFEPSTLRPGRSALPVRAATAHAHPETARSKARTRRARSSAPRLKRSLVSWPLSPARWPSLVAGANWYSTVARWTMSSSEQSSTSVRQVRFDPCGRAAQGVQHYSSGCINDAGPRLFRLLTLRRLGQQRSAATSHSAATLRDDVASMKAEGVGVKTPSTPRFRNRCRSSILSTTQTQTRSPRACARSKNLGLST